MTKEDKIQAFAMLLDGHNSTEIAKKFNVSRQYICHMFNVSNLRVEIEAKRCVYPRIAAWMIENNAGYSRMAQMIGGTTQQTMYYNLTNEGSIKKYMIDDILHLTGLTYEEAFQTER